MKVEIEIDEVALKDLVLNKIADQCVREIYGDYYDMDPIKKARRKEIFDKIDWKNSASKMGDSVVQKFFMKLLDGIDGKR